MKSIIQLFSLMICIQSIMAMDENPLSVSSKMKHPALARVASGELPVRKSQSDSTVLEIDVEKVEAGEQNIVKIFAQTQMIEDSSPKSPEQLRKSLHQRLCAAAGEAKKEGQARRNTISGPLSSSEILLNISNGHTNGSK